MQQRARKQNSGGGGGGGWKEHEDKEDEIASLVNTTLSQDQKDALFPGKFSPAREHFAALESKGKGTVTAQDRALFSLCRPERLLDLTYRFTLFDGHTKKIARYQQFFVVRGAMSRVK